MPEEFGELRVEAGWDIISGVTARTVNEEAVDLFSDARLPEMQVDDYMLRSPEPNEEAARRWAVAKEIRNTNQGVKKKILEYFRRNVGSEVSGEELSYLAKNRTEWARRVRELRTEEGWPIVTRFTGDPNLPMGVYVLQQDRQAPVHDRKIPDQVRGDVLQRDEYKCQFLLDDSSKCGWNFDQWNRADPRILELHHVTHHARGGSNEADNLITVCNVCHDEIHRRERE